MEFKARYKLCELSERVNSILQHCALPVVAIVPSNAREQYICLTYNHKTSTCNQERPSPWHKAANQNPFINLNKKHTSIEHLNQILDYRNTYKSIEREPNRQPQTPSSPLKIGGKHVLNSLGFNSRIQGPIWIYVQFMPSRPQLPDSLLESSDVSAHMLMETNQLSLCVPLLTTQME